ncbi:MAG TPA: citrate synthase family protein [Stellaceae bacterium]|jgi:citrate synthase
MLLSARETAERLGIKLDTVYAYVSRGLLRSVEVADSRERHYDADDVERFRVTRGGAKGARQAEALMPVIPSTICLIENHRFYYRGEDALALADTATLEQVAGLLWQDAPPAVAAPRRSALEVPGLIERCQARLAQLAAGDYAALDLTRGGIARTGGLILGELAACLGAAGPGFQPVDERLAALWKLGPKGRDVVRRALVLLADHELNASTFVARCVASTGATPYAVVSAALAALSGRRHGGASVRTEALCQALGEGDPLAVMAARLARGEDLPGVGHPLYPEGDPRAAALFAAVKTAVPEKADWADRIVDAVVQLTGKQPNVDFGLGVATVALGLPQGAALSLFLVARSVGWIAHAIEQYESGVLIRPRARYTGQRRSAGV